MAARTRHEPSQLFTMRVWQEQLGEGRCEWRGRVQDVLTGRAFYFRTWQDLTQRLCALLETTPSTSEREQVGDR